MFSIFIILNDIDRLDEILKVFYEFGCGATTLDSTGLGKLLLESEEVPIFSGIRKIIEGCKPSNKTIISVIKEKNKLRKIVDELNNKYISKEGTGIMFVVPVVECYGLRNESYENY